MIATVTMLAEVIGPSGGGLGDAAPQAQAPGSFFGAASDWSLLMLLGGAALLALWILGGLRARAARAGDSPARRLGGDEAPPARPELDLLAARLAATLDQRAERLERLIAAADERLAALAESADIHTRPAPSVAARVDAPQADNDALAAPRRRAAPRSRGGRAAAVQADPVTSRIYSLADEGGSAASIARDVGEPIGKVELILALRGA